MYALVPFHPPEPARPVSLGDLLLAARDSVNAAFHSCLDQIRRVRIADGFRRRGLGTHTAGPGALDGINTSIFDGLEMRVDAQTHGASLEFLNQAAALLHLPELVNAG